MRKMKIGRIKIVLVASFHALAYVILILSLFAKNAVMLVVLIPSALACLFLGIALWLLVVWKEAREKELL